jgi:hypothetical protein
MQTRVQEAAVYDISDPVRTTTPKDLKAKASPKEKARSPKQ